MSPKPTTMNHGDVPFDVVADHTGALTVGAPAAGTLAAVVAAAADDVGAPVGVDIGIAVAVDIAVGIAVGVGMGVGVHVSGPSKVALRGARGHGAVGTVGTGVFVGCGVTVGALAVASSLTLVACAETLVACIDAARNVALASGGVSVCPSISPL